MARAEVTTVSRGQNLVCVQLAVRGAEGHLEEVPAVLKQGRALVSGDAFAKRVTGLVATPNLCARHGWFRLFVGLQKPVRCLENAEAPAVTYRLGQVATALGYVLQQVMESFVADAADVASAEVPKFIQQPRGQKAASAKNRMEVRPLVAVELDLDAVWRVDLGGPSFPHRVSTQLKEHPAQALACRSPTDAASIVRVRGDCHRLKTTKSGYRGAAADTACPTFSPRRNTPPMMSDGTGILPLSKVSLLRFVFLGFRLVIHAKILG